MDITDAHHEILDFPSEHVGCSTDDVMDALGSKTKTREATKSVLDELVHEGHIQGNRDLNRDDDYWTDLTLIAPGGIGT